MMFAKCFRVTDLHQQGADHCVDSAHFGDGGHLVATQYVSLQCLCADLHLQLTCVHTYSVILKVGLYWLPLPVTLSHFVYGGKAAFLFFKSLSSLFLHPSSLCFPSSPCFPSYSPSLIPICCLIILPLPHTALSLSPPLFLPSQPTILHTEDKYRSPPEGEVSECFVRDTTWLVSTSDCQHTSKGELEERNLTFIRASFPSLLMEADRNPLLSGQAALQQQPPFFASSSANATAVSALNAD